MTDDGFCVCKMAALVTDDGFCVCKMGALVTDDGFCVCRMGALVTDDGAVRLQDGCVGDRQHRTTNEVGSTNGFRHVAG